MPVILEVVVETYCLNCGHRIVESQYRRFNSAAGATQKRQVVVKRCAYCPVKGK